MTPIVIPDESPLVILSEAKDPKVLRPEKRCRFNSTRPFRILRRFTPQNDMRASSG